MQVGTAVSTLLVFEEIGVGLAMIGWGLGTHDEDR